MTDAGIPESAGDLPEVVDFNKDAKELIIASVKTVLKRMADAKIWRSTTVYDELLNHPPLVGHFIRVFTKHKELAEDLLVDAAGSPVTDFDTKLVCGYTLSEIERGLVVTCAKRSWAMVLGKDLKAAEAEELRNSIIPKEIRRYLCYRWQLPLLESYGRYLDDEHVSALGTNMLCLKSPETVQAVGETPVAAIARMRDLAGDDFETVFATTPAAVRGLNRCNDEEFATFQRLAGDEIWRMMSNDPKVISMLKQIGEDRLEVLGPLVADISLANLKSLVDLQVTTMAPIVETFQKAYGKYAGKLLALDAFATAFLNDLARNFRSRNTSHPDDQAMVASDANMKWMAMRAKVADWYRGQNS